MLLYRGGATSPKILSHASYATIERMAGRFHHLYAFNFTLFMLKECPVWIEAFPRCLHALKLKEMFDAPTHEQLTELDTWEKIIVLGRSKDSNRLLAKCRLYQRTSRAALVWSIRWHTQVMLSSAWSSTTHRASSGLESHIPFVIDMKRYRKDKKWDPINHNQRRIQQLIDGVYSLDARMDSSGWRLF